MQWVKTKRFHLCMLLLLSICFLSIDVYSEGQSVNSHDEIHDYIINKRTGKIHTEECPSVLQMSEKNKISVSDTLLNLLKQDYVICRRCRAGVRKSGARELWNHILHKNLYGDEIEITASYEDYLEAIDEMSEWYVDHVPTYASYVQDEAYAKYNGKFRNYKEYVLRNRRKSDTYRVLTPDTKASSVESLALNDRILRGTENAAINYRDVYNQIDFDRRIAYYPCNLLVDSPDYNMPGDDCVRYLFAVFNRMDAKFTEKYASLTKSSCSRTSSKRIASDYKDVAYGFMNLGFKVYDASGRALYIDNDSIAEGYIFTMDSSFQLHKGDIIARDGHVHIYLGNGTTIEAENFGWGRVYRSYPQKYNIQIENHDGRYNVTLVNGAGEKEYYPRVYRYYGKGGN